MNGLTQYVLGLSLALGLGYIASMLLADRLGGLFLVAMAMVSIGVSFSLSARYRWLGVGLLSVFAVLALGLVALFVVGELYSNSVDREDESESSAPAMVRASHR